MPMNEEARQNLDFFSLGLAAARKGCLKTAVDALTLTLAFHPGHVEAWNLLGLCLYRQGKLNAAEVCFSRSLSFCPDDPRVMGYLGECRTLRTRQSEWMEQVGKIQDPSRREKDSLILFDRLFGEDIQTTAQQKLVLRLQPFAEQKRPAGPSWLDVLKMDREDGEALESLLREEMRARPSLKQRLTQKIGEAVRLASRYLKGKGEQNIKEKARDPNHDRIL